MTSGQETELIYSYNAGVCTGELDRRHLTILLW